MDSTLILPRLVRFAQTLKGSAGLTLLKVFVTIGTLVSRSAYEEFIEDSNFRFLLRA